MAEGAKFVIIRKLLKTLGLSEEAINDVVEWIEDLLSGKNDKKELTEIPYKLRDDFLSPAERSFYLVVRECVSKWADVCPKVNLGDVFFASCQNFGEKQSYTNKINRKHVDFLICDKKTAKPLLGIELDDKSHDKKQRLERDTFVEKVFEKAGLPLERIPVQHAYNPTELNARFQKFASIIVETISESSNIQQDAEEKKQADPICPNCGAEMKLRSAKTGNNRGKKFWGCLNFPKCRSILPYEKY